MTNHSPALDRVFHALASPARRAIVERLLSGEATVGEVAEPLHMALPSVLQHVRVLEESGLVLTRKSGRERRCRLDTAVLTAAEGWLARQRAVWEGRLDRLDHYVRTLHAKEIPS